MDEVQQISTTLEEVQGHCSFEALDPADLASALDSINPDGQETGLCLPSPGAKSIDEMIDWSTAEVALAFNATKSASRERHSINAVMHARRALSCLVDWYLMGLGFSFCKDPPSNSWEASGLLLQQGIIDELTRRVLARAIDVRNSIEHDYTLVSLAQSEDIVELLRRTCRDLVKVRNPLCAPCFLGSLQYGVSSNEDGRIEARFRGWSQPYEAKMILATFCSPAWIGIVIPQSKSAAIVRKTLLRDVSSNLISQVLKKFKLSNSSGYWTGPVYWNAIGAAVGLVPVP